MKNRIKKFFTVIISLMLIYIPLSSNATNTGKYTFFDGNKRSTGTYTVMHNTSTNMLPIPKIVSPSGVTGKITYCAKDGLPISSTNYDVELDYRNTSSSSWNDTYKALLPSGDNYNKLMWLLDNISYDDATVNEMLSVALKSTDFAGLKKADIVAAMPKNATYTSEELFNEAVDCIQQSAIWYFSNASDKTDYRPKIISSGSVAPLKIDGTALDDYICGDAADENNKLYDGNYVTPFDYIYSYLFNEADKNGTYTQSSVTLTLDKQNGFKTQYTSDGNYWFAGPYKLSGSAKLSDVSITNNGQLYNSISINDKKTTDLTSSDVFYVGTPSSASNFKLTIKYTKVGLRSLNFLSISDLASAQSVQPLIAIDPGIEGVEQVSDEESITPPTGSYSIKLIKVDSENSTIKLPGAVFTINGNSYTTDANGEINNIPAIEINQSNFNNTDSISISETKAPSGYSKIISDINLSVKKSYDLANNKYVVSSATLSNTNEISVSVQDSVITISAKDKKDDVPIFDLALRKFITKVNDKELTGDESREPKVDTSNYGKEVNGKTVTTFTYVHSKIPVKVEHNDRVIYTIRVYNEGNKSGYAEEIKDDIPDGIEFLPNDDLNKQYLWKMVDNSGNETTDISKVKYITTTYYSKTNEKTAGANELKSWDGKSVPDYKDVKVAFKVTIPNTDDRIITNKAQISKDSDDDIDSKPNEWNEGEDDQDVEHIYVKYFDLALRKWVSQAIAIEDGQTKIKNTGHKAEDNPEEIVKVEVNKKRLKSTIIKFKYQIRVSNEGEIAGYATELSDYIPSGLKFDAKDNPLWKDAGNGKVTSDQLKNTLIEPGKSETVELTLTWINSDQNIKLMTNVAEISDDDNPSKTPDIDSVPNNKKSGEDDIDDAPVIITMVTGSAPLYIGITFGVLSIIAFGAYMINKKVLFIV